MRASQYAAAEESAAQTSPDFTASLDDDDPAPSWVQRQPAVHRSAGDLGLAAVMRAMKTPAPAPRQPDMSAFTPPAPALVVHAPTGSTASSSTTFAFEGEGIVEVGACMQPDNMNVQAICSTAMHSCFAMQPTAMPPCVDSCRRAQRGRQQLGMTTTMSLAMRLKVGSGRG